jgi:hypothetical protein
MGINFNIEYNTMKSTLIVEQNGKPVSRYSQFSHCNNNPFLQWYKNIADYCFQEANGMYSVHFNGGLILKSLLEKELSSQNGCTNFSYEADIIKGIDRMHLLEDLLKYSQLKVKKLEIGISFESAKKQCFEELKKLVGNTSTLQYLDLKELPIYLRISNGLKSSSGISILSTVDEYNQLASAGDSNTPRLAIIINSGKLRFLNEMRNCFLFSCDIGEVQTLIRSWISEILFPEYVVSIVRDLRNCHTWRSVDYQSAMKMIDIMYGNTPYLDLSVTDSIELCSIGGFQLIKFPKDIPCRMYSSNANIALLGNGGIIKPMGEGSAEVVAEVKNHPSIRTSKSITVYKYKTVQKIQLSTVSANVIVGERITVRCELFPIDAHNKALGKWTVSPIGSLKMLSNTSGSFEAIKPGRCEVVYSVGNVQERLSILVSAKASSISFVDKSVSVKLYDTTKRITAVVHPQGAKGGVVKYKISNTSVLDFDANNGQIIPKREGNSVITAILLDNRGAIIDDCNCNVTILPPKDVITPDGALVLLIVSLIGSLLLLHNECQFLCGISGLIGAIWYSYKEKSKRGYITSVILFTIIVLLICVGGIV